ncbi:hypothetical protein BD779DRAFT_1754494 [Infundibulicybe gibba]|nr:hypothetical protein BD779DRAFT_1450882 [Infundibulicybe gibba]KAF8881982.1 hypothetical protein BD779DRAFT_1754494 [Infundibulicybe gibba]
MITRHAVSGAEAISNFLESNGREEIPPGLRRQIREIQELLPQAATTSRKLAYSIFRTAQKNSICRYHQKYRAHKQRDGFNNESGSTYLIRGPAYAKKLGGIPHADHMHCGCSIEVALMEFFFWKTWTIRSTHPSFDIIESMREEVLLARPRAFFVQAYKTATGLCLEDLYGADYGTMKYFERLGERQARGLVNKLNATRQHNGMKWALVKIPVEAIAPDLDSEE